ncbi:MAG TPA: hypothetical protein VMF53_15485 [Alphaproteobacteria bacterium]|nr:hypothetical protein [Alphaproteobacteria bacterium]
MNQNFPARDNEIEAVGTPSAAPRAALSISYRRALFRPANPPFHGVDM